MSASLPTSSEPISWFKPWAIAGLTVSLATYGGRGHCRDRSDARPCGSAAASSAPPSERTPHRLARPTHALRVAGGDSDHPEVVQHALCTHRAAADPIPDQAVITVRVMVQPMGGKIIS